MRIEINAGGIQGNASIEQMKSELTSLLESSLRLQNVLDQIKAYASNVSGGTARIGTAISNIQRRAEAENRRAQNIRDASNRVETFMANTRATDRRVAQQVTRNTKQLYDTNGWSSAIANAGNAVVNNLAGHLNVPQVAADDILRQYRETLNKLDEGDGFLGVNTMRNRILDSTRKQMEEAIDSGEVKLSEEQRKQYEKIRNDRFYDKLAEADRKNIEAKVENMPRKIKKLYKHYFDRTKIGRTDAERGCFEPGSGGIFYDEDNDTLNVPLDKDRRNKEITNEGDAVDHDPYKIYFHEMGHSIDYNYRSDGEYYTHLVKINGQSLYDVLRNETEGFIRKVVKTYTKSNPGFTHEDQETVIKYYMEHRKISFESLTSDQQKVARSLRAKFVVDIFPISKEEYSEISDILGGITDNLFVGGSGHEDDGYWYDSNGNTTLNQASEFFAHYFSAKARGESASDNLDAILRVFPKSSAFVEAMISQMNSTPFDC